MRRIGAPCESTSERSEFRFAVPMQSRAARRSAGLPGDANARELVLVGAAFSVPFLAGQKGDILRPEPEGRLYGTNLRADQGQRPLDGTGKDTFSNPDRRREAGSFRGWRSF